MYWGRPPGRVVPSTFTRGFFLVEASLDSCRFRCYYIHNEKGGPMDFINNIWASKLGKIGVIAAVIIVIVLIAT